MNNIKLIGNKRGIQIKTYILMYEGTYIYELEHLSAQHFEDKFNLI